ncbi:MAG TPA: hypothetical protein VFE17_01330 [Candidatus Baltobacteraceae bacterium]|jgi:hypothetical protein|nr:hypothetical protein [Candidatus Baltobacteraceae bacterium]
MSAATTAVLHVDTAGCAAGIFTARAAAIQLAGFNIARAWFMSALRRFHR